jgi:hypothetical protein
MGVLGVLAALAVLIGGAQTTLVLAQGEGLSAERSPTPVVEVQTIETDRSAPDSFGR